MKVKYYSRIPEGYGNVIWFPAYPMRKGKFPPAHPCHDNPEPMVFTREEQPVSDDPLGKFRALGYYASCFPEGDGFCFDPPDGKTSMEVVRDIERCFGLEVEICRL